MGVKEIAKKQILKMERIIERINEAEDLLISLKAPALNNLINSLRLFKAGAFKD